MAVGGIILRFGYLILRVLQFCVAGIGLGLFSYFLSVLADRNISIPSRWLAVEGLTGSATLYTLLAFVFGICLAGNAVFGFLGILLDICFVGAFAYVAYATRHGTDSCKGFVQTPLGNGQSNSYNLGGYGPDGFGSGSGENLTYSVSLHTACIFNRVVFACSIIAIFLFLITAVWQVMMIKHHKKEKKYGPSPSNNYTSGSGKTPFWKRGRRNKRTTRDMETAGAMGPTGTAVRPSHETGTTLGNNAYASEPKYGEPGYGNTTYGAPANTYHDRTTADGRF